MRKVYQIVLKIQFVAKYRKRREISKKNEERRISKQSHSAEKFEGGDPLVFLKNIKKHEGGPFGDKKFREIVAQCRKKFKRGAL